METWSVRERWQMGTLWSFGLGCLVGAFEGVVLSATLRLPLDVIMAVGIFEGVASFGLGLVGGLAGALAGVVHLARPDGAAHRNLALQLAGAALVLGLVTMLPAAMDLHRQGRTGAGVAMAMIGLGGAGVVLFNARYWLARMELDKAPPIGWIPASLGGSLVLLVISTSIYLSRDTGGAYGLDGDPNLLLITVDGWSAADPLTESAQRLGERGVVFDQAVTPSTSSLAAHGAILTGLHPLRHRGLDDRRPIPLGMPTLPKLLASDGWATAGFVSTVSVSAHSGLQQGFHVFDDAVDGFSGMTRVRWLGLLADGLGMRRPARPAEATVGAFETWLEAHTELPWFAWVHLPAPDDAAIARITEAVDGSGLSEHTMIVLVGATGAGEGPPLSEARVRVPLILVAPGRPAEVERVKAQARLMDLHPTIVAYAGLDTPARVEGVDLLGFLDGRRSRGLWASLLSWDGTRWWMGVRTEQVKYVVDLLADEEELFDLVADPEETHDLSGDQPDALAQSRGLLVGDRAALGERLEDPGLRDPGVHARLDALGVP